MTGKFNKKKGRFFFPPTFWIELLIEPIKCHIDINTIKFDIGIGRW